MSDSAETRSDIDLEAAIQAFQQAVARSREATAAAANESPAVRYGHQPVYVVQRLTVELNVGVQFRRVVQDGEPREAVFVDTESPQPGARLNFEVSASPLEAPLNEPTLLLGTPRVERGGQPLPAAVVLQAGDEVRVMAFVHNALGAPVPAIPVSLRLHRLTPGPARDNPGAPDGERWVKIAEDAEFVGPEVTDGRGLVELRFPVPALPAEEAETTLLRIKAQGTIPVTPGAPVTEQLFERQPQFVRVRTGEETVRSPIGARSLGMASAPLDAAPAFPRGRPPAPPGLTLTGAEPVPLEEAIGPAEEPPPPKRPRRRRGEGSDA
jgi:hypothetical protein